MPLLGVDAKREVDFDILNATNVTGYFPGELLVGMPGFAHTQECRMGYGLRVGSDTVMLCSREVDMRRT